MQFTKVDLKISARARATAFAAVAIITMLNNATRAVAQCEPEWSPVGTGMNGTVKALLSFDDGNGPALYAGGGFLNAGGEPAGRIARWDGTNWSALGDGVDGPLTPAVRALAVFDDGTGEALYVGGRFDTAGGAPALHVAKWDGQNWSSVGTQMTAANDQVYTLAVYDDGSGQALYAGGWFNSAGGTSASNIARWDGQQWFPLGSGLNGIVETLAVFDDGTGETLYAAGNFTTAGGISANYIAKWDGASWSRLQSGTDARVHALAVYNDGSGESLYAGGAFWEAGGVTVNRVAEWNGSNWSALSTGMDFPVWSLAVHDDHSGPKLYAGGLFTEAGGRSTNHVAKWNGLAWSKLDIGLDEAVEAMAVHRGALFVGGNFKEAGGMQAKRVARWGAIKTEVCTGLEWVVKATCTGGRLKVLVKGGKGREKVTVSSLVDSKTVKTKGSGKKVVTIDGASCGDDRVTVTWACGAQAVVPYRCQ